MNKGGGGGVSGAGVNGGILTAVHQTAHPTLNTNGINRLSNGGPSALAAPGYEKKERFV